VGAFEVLLLALMGAGATLYLLWSNSTAAGFISDLATALFGPRKTTIGGIPDPVATATAPAHSGGDVVSMDLVRSRRLG
jgi:hypothetical protein